MSSEDDYIVDGMGNKMRRQFESDAARKLHKKRRIVQRMKTAIGNFFKEHTIADLLPYNQKLVVLNHEMSISQTIEAMVRQQNTRIAIIWDK